MDRLDLFQFATVGGVAAELEPGVTDMANVKCESCKFFDEHKVNGAAAAADEGLCRFNPPVSQPEPQGHGLWPVVGAADWCGHFTPAMSAAE